MKTIPEILQMPETVIVDVRTPGEFMGGHVVDSINIPLNEIPERLEEFKSMQHVMLCCASGARSMAAADFLKRQGIACSNGGPWTTVNFHANNK